MPEISRFYGILIKMYFGDHLPPRALALVVEWAAMHQQELLDNWNSLTNTDVASFKKIAPLK